MNKIKRFYGIGSILLAAACFWGQAFAQEAPAPRTSSTNISVDSTELEPFSIDKATDPEGRPTFYTNGNMAVGFNEDGDPNVATRF